jgi:type I restriction enzyme, S subunit
MNPAQLLGHFDRISDAPDAMPRLRRFILDLAVRGKLVEQDPRDEPASDLLKRIQTEKARLVNADEIKKEKPLPAIEEDEIPFEIPARWRWIRLNDITSYIQRGKSPKYATAEGLPVISQKCVQWDGLELDFAKLITSESIEEYEPIRFLRNGDLLWNSTGTGTIGRIIKVNEPPPKLVCDSHVTVVRCLEVDAEYVRSWLRSDHVYAVIEDRAAGSTNQVELTSQLAMNQVVPLPPLAEQHRIVAKVDELMALCGRLEAAQTERESRRDRLAAASLNRLNNGADADEFREHARFYFNHLPRLTTRPEHIDQLRQTILTLAVRGKLVTQEPSDEAARNVISRIFKDHVEFWQNESPKGPPVLKFESDEGPYKLPASWVWGLTAGLTQPGKPIRYGILKPGKDTPGGVPYVRIFEMKNGTIDVSALNRCDPKHEAKFREARVQQGDILVSKDGTIGKVAIVPRELEGGNITQHLLRVSPSKRIFGRYLALAIQAPPCQSWMTGEVRGLALQGINVGDFRRMPIPVPPVAEQRRIVAKVDELIGLCDRLEAQLTTTQTESRRLLVAVLHRALTA